MSRLRLAIATIALTGLLAGGSVFGQSPAPLPKPAATKAAKPAGGIVQTARKEWDGINTMTRRQWNAMKRTWAQQKRKWADCNSGARKQRLSTANRWTFVGKCMVK